MIEHYNTKAIEVLMDSMNQGIVYVDTDHKIQICNRRAREITGIIISAHASHDRGHLEEGDIVILADNKLGDDDGSLGAEELELLNIRDKDIRSGDMLVAAGVYGNKKIEPVYKYVRGHQMNMPLKIDINYLGFHITAGIDMERKETVIQVNEGTYRLKYYFSVGNMVAIDGRTGSIKFFQAKGYSVRNEDAGNILRGHSWLSKTTEDCDIDVTGRPFLEFFDESMLTRRLFAVLEGEAQPVRNQLYEINRRPFICNIVPWDETENKGAFLMIRDAENLENLLNDRNEIIRQIEEKEDESQELNREYPEDAFTGFAGKSAKAREVKYMAWKASQSRFNVIITGESGTGKSKLAREIHKIGMPDAPFVEVNCNAIAPSLFESELFGYVGGAFTGAKSEGKIGFFEAADGGTIFLDEIGEIPLDIQVKLLHVLQNKIIYRVGSSRPVKVNVRVIAATNKNLEEEVALGHFRQDLFYRINVFPIEIPPIRERKADLYLLINQLLEQVCDMYGLEQKQFSGEALQKLVSYNWPGNVRELENAIERAVTLCDSNIIYPEHLKIGRGDIPRTMREMLAREEERILEMTLLKFNGDKNKAMKELDMSRTVFYDKLKKYNIRY
ncbi:MAG: sigma 54-interacting transcriptional regulator [Emergencia sp.]